MGRNRNIIGALEEAATLEQEREPSYPTDYKPKFYRAPAFTTVIIATLLSASLATAYFNPELRHWTKEAFSNAVSKVVTFFTPDLSPYEAEAFASRGLSARSKGQFAESSQMLKQAMARYVKRGDMAGIAVAHVELGILHTIKKQYPLAKVHLEQAALYYDKEDDFDGMAYASINLGKMHFAQKQFKLAAKSYKEAEGYYRESGNSEGLANINRALGTLSIAQNNYPEALRYFGEAESIYEEAKNNRGLVLTYNAMSKLFSKQGDDKLFRRFNERAKAIKLNGSSSDLPKFSIKQSFDWLIAAFKENKSAYESELNSKAKEETERALR